MVKSCSVGWGAKVAAVFAALYTSILGLAVLIPHANSGIEVFSGVMVAGLGIPPKSKTSYFIDTK